MASKPTGPVRATNCLLVQLAAAIGTAHLPLAAPAIEAARNRDRGVPPATGDDLARYFAAIGELAPRIDADELSDDEARYWHDRWHPLSVALGNMTSNKQTRAFDGVWWALSTVMYDWSFNDANVVSARVSDYCAIRAICSANRDGVDYTAAARVVGISSGDWPMFVTFVTDSNHAVDGMRTVSHAIEMVTLVTAPRH